MTVLIIEDLVSRKWITHVVSNEETHTQVIAGFEQALDAEGLLDAAVERADQLGQRVGPDHDDGVSPILLAVSERLTDDRGEHPGVHGHGRDRPRFGRPSTPTDQAWIESLNGTIKYEWSLLLAITDPAVLRAELDVIRTEYNTRRLHSGIGYVTPEDEHTGRGPAIRQARRDGLERAADAALPTTEHIGTISPTPETPMWSDHPPKSGQRRWNRPPGRCAGRLPLPGRWRGASTRRTRPG